MPTTHDALAVAGPAGRRRVQDVPRHLREPELGDHAGEPDRRRRTRRPSTTSRASGSGRGRRPRRRADEVDKEINDGARSSRPGAVTRDRHRPSTRRRGGRRRRRRARGGAAPAPVTAARCWPRRCSASLIFFVYPLIASVYYSFTRFDLLSRAAVGRPAQLPSSCSPRTRTSGSRRGNTLWFVVILVPAACSSARSSSPALLARASRRGAASSARSSTCRRWCRRWPATIAFVFLLNPATGPVNTFLGCVRHRRAAVVQRPGAGPSRRWCCSACGASATS